MQNLNPSQCPTCIILSVWWYIFNRWFTSQNRLIWMGRVRVWGFQRINLRNISSRNIDGDLIGYFKFLLIFFYIFHVSFKMNEIHFKFHRGQFDPLLKNFRYCLLKKKSFSGWLNCHKNTTEFYKFSAKDLAEDEFVKEERIKD